MKVAGPQKIDVLCNWNNPHLSGILGKVRQRVLNFLWVSVELLEGTQYNKLKSEKKMGLYNKWPIQVSLYWICWLEVHVGRPIYSHFENLTKLRLMKKIILRKEICSIFIIYGSFHSRSKSLNLITNAVQEFPKQNTRWQCKTRTLGPNPVLCVIYEWNKLAGNV